MTQATDAVQQCLGDLLALQGGALRGEGRGGDGMGAVWAISEANVKQCEQITQRQDPDLCPAPLLPHCLQERNN